MNKTPFLSVIVSALITTVLVASGCATIVTGTDQSMNFNSEPDGATVKVNGKVLGKTPLTVKLDKAKHQSLAFEKEGYKTYTTELSTSLEGWFWGNILIGGVIGSTTDAAAGGMYEYSPDQYFVTLTPLDNYGIPTSQSRNAKQFAMAYMTEIRMELASGGGKNIDTLLNMLGVKENQKDTAIKALKRLSDQNPDDLDFAASILELYGLKVNGQ